MVFYLFFNKNIKHNSYAEDKTFNRFSKFKLYILHFIPLHRAINVYNHILIHLPPVPHICVRESDEHWVRYWLFAYSTPSHYLNQCWNIVNWAHRNKSHWNIHQNTKLFIQENAFENIVCEMAAILSRGDEWNVYRNDEEVWDLSLQNLWRFVNWRMWKWH